MPARYPRPVSPRHHCQDTETRSLGPGDLPDTCRPGTPGTSVTPTEPTRTAATSVRPARG